MLKPVVIPTQSGSKQKTKAQTIDPETGDIMDAPAPKHGDPDAPPQRRSDLEDLLGYLQAKWAFRYNLLRSEVEVKSGNTSWVQMDDFQLNTIVVQAKLDGYKTSVATVKMVLESSLTPTYHPIREYFEALPPWDGKDYIGAYCARITLTKPENQPYLAPLVRRWMLAAAGCALHIVTRNEVCLVLIGGQGLGKTTWLDNICPRALAEYRVTGPIVPDKKDQSTANMLAEMWFVNIDDQLENLFGKDANALKNIITSDDVVNRKAYARLTKKRKRVASFMASVNSSNFLTDTSNRRYLCFEVADIDRSKILEDATPMWSQVKALLQKGERVTFSAEEVARINAMNLDFAEITPEMELVQRYLQPAKPTDATCLFATNTDILRFLQFKTAGNLRLNTKVLGRALTRLQFEQHSRRGYGPTPLKVYPLHCNEPADADYFRNNYQPKDDTPF
jgi:predicted P-loop ATPase